MSPSALGVRLWRARSRALGLVGRAGSTILRIVPMGDRTRRFVLERTWAHLPAEALDSYLVSGYQNPRINMQSILLRHFLVRRLFDDAFDDLMDEEIRFAIELNDVIRIRASELGVRMGSYVDPEKHASVMQVDEAIAGRADAFAHRWDAALADRRAPPLVVLELACGSANDYRAFVDYGLARFLDYRGVDLTPRNIANARQRFPDVQFEVGDVLTLPYADGSFDYVIAADLFEHLSPGDMERALDEAGRMARRGVVLTFFNMSDEPDHQIRRKGAYHWNRVSRRQVEAVLRRRMLIATATRIASWLRDRYGYANSYNRHAWTIVAERVVG